MSGVRALVRILRRPHRRNTGVHTRTGYTGTRDVIVRYGCTRTCIAYAPAPVEIIVISFSIPNLNKIFIFYEPLTAREIQDTVTATRFFFFLSAYRFPTRTKKKIQRLESCFCCISDLVGASRVYYFDIPCSFFQKKNPGEKNASATTVVYYFRFCFAFPLNSLRK